MALRIVLLAGLAAGWCPGQSSFSVASVRMTDLARPTLRFRIGPDGFTAALTLKNLIQQAYDVQDYQVSGGAPWVSSQRYDIQAKADHEVSATAIRAMLQALLADRFSLKFHRETRTMAGYVLSVDKGGSKLPPPRTDVLAGSKGTIQVGGGEFQGRGASIANLANALRIELGRPVIDRTGIAGNYDFRLRFDETNHDLEYPPGSAGAASEPSGSVFTALRELGLRLEARKVEIEVLAIESAAMPSEN